MIDIDSYLMEEVRNEFLVDSNRKKLWKIELDIFQEFDRICKKYSLNYFVLGGALIGAIRHKGFIPWDDDLDIGMMREDMIRFLKVAPRELAGKYYIHDGISDPDYYAPIVRIRDNNSTGICKIDLNRKSNNGIFIEIYPFDHVIDSKIKYNVQKFEIKCIHHILYLDCYGVKKNIKSTVSCNLSSLIVSLIGKKRLFDKMNKIAARYNTIQTEYVDEIVTGYNCRYKYTDLVETIETDFEYTKVRIPKGYDSCLKITYGDYMKLPPVDKRNHHSDVIYYNPDLPYSDKKATKMAENYFKNI